MGNLIRKLFKRKPSWKDYNKLVIQLSDDECNTLIEKGYVFKQCTGQFKHMSITIETPKYYTRKFYADNEVIGKVEDLI